MMANKRRFLRGRNMIIVVFLVCILVILLGAFIVAYFDCEISGGIMLFCGVIGGIASFIAAISLLVNVAELKVIDQKIDMYQTENTYIESQIAECVEQYQQYETEIFTEVNSESAITLISLYPELKADRLVSKQIEVYLANNEKIKELKEVKINGEIYRWWLYFGKSETEN